VDVEGRAEFLAIGFQRLPESGAIMGLDSRTHHLERVKHVDMLALQPVDEHNHFVGHFAPFLGRLV